MFTRKASVYRRYDVAGVPISDYPLHPFCCKASVYRRYDVAGYRQGPIGLMSDPEQMLPGNRPTLAGAAILSQPDHIVLPIVPYRRVYELVVGKRASEQCRGRFIVPSADLSALPAPLFRFRHSHPAG